MIFSAIVPLLFSWLPAGLAVICIAMVTIFVLVFFIEIILKIISILRG